MYNALNFSVASSVGNDLQNRTVLSQQVASLLCPSENIRTTNQIVGGVTSTKSYHANVGGPACINAWTGIFTALPQDQFGYNGVYTNRTAGMLGFAQSPMGRRTRPCSARPMSEPGRPRWRAT